MSIGDRVSSRSARSSVRSSRSARREVVVIMGKAVFSQGVNDMLQQLQGAQCGK